jgi:hypothetical protein
MKTLMSNPALNILMDQIKEGMLELCSSEPTTLLVIGKLCGDFLLSNDDLVCARGGQCVSCYNPWKSH